MTPDGRPLGDQGMRVLVVAASVVVVVAGLRAAAQLVLPFLVAVFLALISVQLMSWLQSKRVPRALAVLCTMLAAVAVMSLLGLAVGRSANEFTRVSPQYQARLQELANSILAVGSDLGLPTDAWRSLEWLPAGSGLFDLVGDALGAVVSFASNTFLVLLTVIFILFEAAGFGAKLRAAFGEEGSHFGQLGRMAEQVQSYLVVKSAISAATGILIGVWVGAWGLDFALLWGLLAFIFNFIPNLGSIIAALPAVLLAFVQLGPAHAAVIAGGYLGINIIFGNFIEPTLMGRRFGLSPLVVFVSLVFWGWLWGPIGMLFSVPLTIVVKIALENTQDFRWVAVMLGANPSAAAPVSKNST